MKTIARVVGGIVIAGIGLLAGRQIAYGHFDRLDQKYTLLACKAYQGEGLPLSDPRRELYSKQAEEYRAKAKKYNQIVCNILSFPFN